jgi:hypothetical protein
MDHGPVRALAHPLAIEPPPRHSRPVRLATTMLMSALIAGLLPGVVLGMVIGPPAQEHCSGAPDIIACLIVTLD